MSSQGYGQVNHDLLYVTYVLPTTRGSCVCAVDPQLDEKQTAAFMQFVRASEAGYPGTFEEYILDTGLDVSVAGLRPVVLDNTEVRPPHQSRVAMQYF